MTFKFRNFRSLVALSIILFKVFGCPTWYSNLELALSKVVLAFEKPFWADQNGDIGGATLTDLPVKQIYYEMNTHKSGTF